MAKEQSTTSPSVIMTSSPAVAYMAPDPAGIAVGAYMAPDPQPFRPTIPSPHSDHEVVSVPTVLGVSAYDPFDFLRPLLTLGLSPMTACRMWSRFGSAAVVVAALAKYVKERPEDLLDNPEALAAAIDEFKETVK